MHCVKPKKILETKNTDPRRSVLAIVGDTQVGLWVVRSLARNGLTVHAVVRSEQGQAAHSRYASSAWVLDSGPSDAAFADEIEGLVRELDVGSIMPIAEGFHNALIDLRTRFEPEVHIFSPSRESFDKATDKDLLQSLCIELGVPVARGMRLDQLMADGKGDALHLPLVLRTRRQNIKGGKVPWKAAYAETKEQLNNLYEQMRDFPENVVVQEYHPGVEDHVQILMHDGELVMAGDYIGEHHMPLAGGVTVQRVSCRHESLIADAVRLLKAIDYEGIAGVQFHYDPATDKYIFLEINPRFSGGLPTVIMAGFEAPFRLWQSRFEPEKMKKDNYRVGLRTRILGGDANWLLAQLRGDALPPGEKHVGKLKAMASFLWNTGPWTRDDSFLWNDPKPFFVDLRQMVKKLGGQGFDIVGN
ncbi:MAG: ATP-grasp domain-containing protein [Deltaproteobacteria bacterium]|nr:ATP-grasp domain-containing protein [Deltaproteobacteria bacterium]